MEQIKLSDIVIGEGLIKTYSINSAIHYLNNNLPSSNNNVYFKKYTDYDRFFLVVKDGKLSSEWTDWVISAANLYGWFPTYFVIDRNPVPYESFEQFINLLNKGKYVQLTFDAKYDIIFDESSLPDFVYHVSPLKYKEKILKIGLIPKAKNKLASTTDRIYFSLNKDGIYTLLKSPSFRQNEKEFVIFKIDVKSLFNRREIVFYKDPAFKNIDGYTKDNIPSQFLGIEKEIKI